MDDGYRLSKVHISFITDTFEALAHPAADDEAGKAALAALKQAVLDMGKAQGVDKKLDLFMDRLRNDPALKDHAPSQTLLRMIQLNRDAEEPTSPVKYSGEVRRKTPLARWPDYAAKALFLTSVFALGNAFRDGIDTPFKANQRAGAAAKIAAQEPEAEMARRYVRGVNPVAARQGDEAMLARLRELKDAMDPNDPEKPALNDETKAAVNGYIDAFERLQNAKAELNPRADDIKKALIELILAAVMAGLAVEYNLEQAQSRRINRLIQESIDGEIDNALAGALGQASGPQAPQPG